VINLNLTSATRLGLNLLALLGVTVALYLAQTIFIPLVIAILLAAMLWPAVDFFNKWARLSWGLSCMLAVSGLVALTLLVTLGIGLAITKIVQDLPTDHARQQRLYTQLRQRLDQISPVPLDAEYFPEEADQSKVFQYIKQALDPEKPYMLDTLRKVAEYLNTWIWHWVLIMFILLFLLLEGRMLSKRIVEIFGPSREDQGKAVSALADMAKAVRTYLVWRTIVNFALAMLVGLVYQWVFHLEQPWTWALLTAILCYVPYLGPIIAGVFPVLDAFITQSPVHALVLIGFYTIIMVVEGYVIVPVVMGRSMELNATTVMLACLFWDLVWGTPGLFLAMPLMAAIKAICWHVPGLRPWANLMSTNEHDPPDKIDPLASTVFLDDLEFEALQEKAASRQAGTARKSKD